MVRTLSTGVAYEIQQQYGTEPFLVVGITWSPNQISPYYYSEKEYTPLGLTGNVISVSPLDDVTAFDQSGRSAQVSVTLDDTLGSIKAMLNAVDVHKRPLYVYQCFAATGDLTLVFSGLVNTPLVWSEGERTVTVTAVSYVEDRESGFSPEEWQFPFLLRDLMGKPWPLVFGSCVHVPAQKVKAQVTGELNTLIGIADPSLQFKMGKTAELWSAQYAIYNYWGAVAKNALGLAPQPLQIIKQYCAVIVQEDGLQHQFDTQYAALGSAEKAAVDKLIDRNLIGTQIRDLDEKIQTLAEQLYTVRQQKDQLEQMAATAQYCVQVAQGAYQRQGQAVTEMGILYNQYVQLGIELCRQQALEVTTLNVIEGNKFPQNVEMDVLIKDIRYRGTFNGNVFSIADGPLPKYSNLPVGTWLGATDPCGDVDEVKGMSQFWLTDPTYALRDCWCQVLKSDGTVHIVRIIDQIGTMCRFELTPWQDPAGGGGGNIDPVSVQTFVGTNGYIAPTAQNPFGGVPILPPSALFTDDAGTGLLDAAFEAMVSMFNTPQQQLDTTINGLLAGADPINQHEYQVLYTLEQLLQVNTNPVLVGERTPADIYTVTGPDIVEILAVAGVPLPNWFTIDYPLTEYPTEVTWQAEVGTPVFDMQNTCEIYVANILPSTIKGVYAYRTVNLPIQNTRILAPIPQSYYKLDQSDALGQVDEGNPGESLTVTTISFYQPLTSVQGENWEGDVYVTLTSSVGPNVSDIIKWLIQTYTDKTADPTTFAQVASQMRGISGELYPCNFALFDRRDVRSQIQEIAWQARCAVFEKDETIYITYLAAQPTPVATIDETLVELSSLKVEYTPTEDLVTRLTAVWLENYLPLLPGKEPNKIVLRYNVAKYLLHAQERNFYIYNIQDLVLKSATFWLIRQANTWKRVTLNTFLTGIAIETFDAVRLVFNQPYVADGPVIGIVENAVYDSDSKSIQLTLWVPVRQGEMSAYPFAFPATMSPPLQFPTQADIQLGYAGGGGPGIKPSGLDCASMGVGPAVVT